MVTAVFSFLRRLVTHNFGLKLLSLAAAIFVFSLVRGSQDDQVSIPVDVHAVLPPESSGMMLVSNLPAQLQVRVGGASSRINQLQLPPLRIDLTDPTVQTYQFDMNAYRFPPGVSLIDWEPRSVSLTWAAVTERTVRVIPKLFGAPPEGLELRGEVTVIPAEVTLRGPERAVATIESISTDRIPLSEFDAGEHRERSVRLEPLPEYTRYFSLSPGDPVPREISVVTVQFELVPRVAERAFARRAVVQLGGEHIAEIRPETVTVVLQGEPSRLDAVTEDQVVPVVQIDDMVAGAGGQALAVAVHTLPEGISLARVDPPAVIVTLPR